MLPILVWLSCGQHFAKPFTNKFEISKDLTKTKSMTLLMTYTKFSNFTPSFTVFY